MPKLNPQGVAEHRSKHPPYVLGAMAGHKKLCAHPKMIDDKGGYADDPEVLTAAFIGSVAAGRMLLEFIGIDVDQPNDRLKRSCHGKRNDDATMEDLGGHLADIDRLNADDARRELLVGFIKMAHKSAAHMTIPDKRAWERTWDAFDLIRLLVDECKWK